MSDTTPPVSLARKLADVMLAVGRIPKRGRNEFHKYDYATEADIVEAIRGELATRHVVLLPAVTACDRVPVGDKGNALTHLMMEFTFIDGETGEQLTRPWMGAGTDKEDKGAYKAMTGGEKYFLLKTFMLPTGDDPDAHEDQPKRPTQTQQPERREAPKVNRPLTNEPPEPRVSEPQRQAIKKAATDAGWTPEEVVNLLKSKFQANSTKEIRVSQVQAVLTALGDGVEEKVHG